MNVCYENNTSAFLIHSSAKLMIPLCGLVFSYLLVVRTMPSVSAATRVFYDGFESGNTSLWSQDDYRNRCPVVTSASDGGAGPRTGNYMARCNWDGTIAGNLPASYESLYIPSVSYTNEVFYRARVRASTNCDRTDGSPLKLLRIYYWDGNTSTYTDIFEVFNNQNGLSNRGDGQVIAPSYWGDAPGDNTSSTSGWHKVEYYFNHATGKVRVWHDGILVRDQTSSFGARRWIPFYLTSNWSDAHDGTNHIYFDDFEVFSDSSSGVAATGSMLDGTIVASGGGTTYTVTPSAGANGTISPNTAQTINSGSTAVFTVTPSGGYTASVGGTCGGSLVGTTYTTNAITANCTVSATFAAAGDTIAPSVPANFDAYSTSTTSVSLEWQASTDDTAVALYRVEYSAGWNTSNWTALGTTSNLTINHTGLTASANPQIYRYRVRAEDAASNASAWSYIHYNATPTIPAFPGAMGGGAVSMGGRGGAIYRVTSLSGGSEAGTLRACTGASGPRTCVFDVAGTIELAGGSSVTIANPYITIAGHTAPGDGITISGKNSSASAVLTVRTHNVIVRNIRLRKGYNASTASQDGDPVNVTSVSTTSGPVGTTIFDHITSSWTMDENGEAWALTPRAPRNITYSNSMFYEPLLDHPVNFLTGAFDRDTADKMTDIDLHNSLLSQSGWRNPLIKNKRFRMTNNLIYNWSKYATEFQGGVNADVIGNVYKTGPRYNTSPEGQGTNLHEISQWVAGGDSTASGSPSLYVVGNKGWNNTDPDADNWAGSMVWEISGDNGSDVGALSTSYKRTSPLSALPYPITAVSANTLESAILPTVGMSRRLDCSGAWVSARDSQDARIITEYTNNTGALVLFNDESTVGGYPILAAGTACTDTDLDGMPDAYETANGLNPNSSADGNGIHTSGYTNLERYLSGNATIPPLPTELIIDNTDTTTSHSGSWSPSTNFPGYYGTNYHYSPNATGHWFEWNATNLSPGTYDVYAYWNANPDRPTDVSYLITHSGGTATSNNINQTHNGSQWNLLGTYTFGTTGTVRVQSGATGTEGTVADAIRFVKTTVTPCNTVTTANFSQSAYNSYGAPFDPFTSNTPLLNVTCNSADTDTINLTTGVTGDTTRIVYTKGYWYDAVTTAWRQYSGTCTGALNGEWCQGSVSATITDANVSTASSTNPTYLVGMTCSVQGGGWKCGCRDTTCSNFSWQVQGAGM